MESTQGHVTTKGRWLPGEEGICQGGAVNTETYYNNWSTKVK